MKKNIINGIVELIWDTPFYSGKYEGDDTFSVDEKGNICGLVLTTAGKEEVGSDFLKVNIPPINFDSNNFEKLKINDFSESKRQYYFDDKILFDYRDTKNYFDLSKFKIKVITNNIVTFFNVNNKIEFLLVIDIYSFDFYPNSSEDSPLKLDGFNLFLKKQIWDFFVRSYLYQYDCSLGEYVDSINSGENLLKNKDIPLSIIRFINSQVEFWKEIIEDEYPNSYEKL
ncbi:hypothetical protein OIU80_15665 [Flavobacterium sp. LS1R47]|uniref:Uncharacterized protein n=1 Tax=Flavobacterium frigoritolerans TaxID=2987686 RepID=A0A9X2ZLI2_9FLAO|nr:hypothetical protein [Flavobacterium frigoritolerans]MCV9933721.1 hypothetical protein [Flavobacterium frigoritolerans]